MWNSLAMATRIAYRADTPGTQEAEHSITKIPVITVTLNQDTIEFSTIPQDDRNNWQEIIKNVIQQRARPFSFLQIDNGEVQRFLFCDRRFAESNVEFNGDGEVVISNETKSGWPDPLKEWIKNFRNNNIAVHVTEENYRIFLNATPNVSLLLDMNQRKLTSQWELTSVIADPTNQDQKHMIMTEIFRAIRDGFQQEQPLRQLLPLYRFESIENRGPLHILTLVKSQSADDAIKDLSTRLSHAMTPPS
jgi:hypothetical protein